jgi:hypothetical protein
LPRIRNSSTVFLPETYGKYGDFPALIGHSSGDDLKDDRAFAALARSLINEYCASSFNGGS